MFNDLVALSNLRKVLAQGMQKLITEALVRNGGSSDADAPDDLHIQNRFILNSVGIAAAVPAMDYAVAALKKQGKLQNVQLTNNLSANLDILKNDAGTYPDFTSVLRQYLLPRSAYLDFDNLVDPRHRIDEECGYPKFITPIMYRYMYDRDDTAQRVNDIYPDESWAVNPSVYDDDDDNKVTDFEKRWEELCDDYQLLQYLYRVDKMCGIGHYGVLLMGLDDGLDLEEPVQESKLLKGTKKSVATKRRELLYLRPFDEYLSFIQKYDTNPNSPRYGQPEMYNLVFADMTIDAAGASIGTRLNRRVHWTRVVHVADNLLGSLVFGVPRSQPVFNRLLDLRKIKGGSGEMFWKGAFPGLSFEVDPRFVADDVEFDQEKIREEIKRYSDGLQRYLTTVGVSAKSLAPQISEPEKHVLVQLQAIAMHKGVPLRIFMGSEEGRLASGQDKLTWNQRLKRRLVTFTEPNLIRNTIDRFVAVGVMPPPLNKKYKTAWTDLNTPTDDDKASLSLKWTQAMAQYVSSGIIHLMEPMDYFVTVMGFQASDARRMIAAVESKGGWKKLMDVDPSQGTGQNGVRSNIADKEKGTSRDKPAGKDSSDKRSDGKAS